MRIYDRYATSEKILEDRTYTSRNQLLKEQIYLVKYLLDKGESEDGIFTLWQTIPSKYIEAFEDQRELRKWFDEHIVHVAYTIKELKPSYGIAICKSEVEYIDKLNVDVYFKKFLLLLLAYSRLGVRKYVKWDRYIRSDLLKQAGVPQIRDRIVGQMARWNKQYLLYDTTPVIFHNKQHIELLNNILLHYDIGDVNKAEYKFSSIESVTILFSMFHNPVKICKCCGKEFTVNSKTQTDLCPDCYHNKRKQQFSAAKRKARENKKKNVNTNVLNV